MQPGQDGRVMLNLHETPKFAVYWDLEISMDCHGVATIRIPRTLLELIWHALADCTGALELGRQCGWWFANVFKQERRFQGHSPVASSPNPIDLGWTIGIICTAGDRPHDCFLAGSAGD
jgi:hypothetical protein